MYKNQLQELAQRSCFNLPSYTSIREGPDHAPRFKAAVNFNGEVFECPAFVTTLRQAEHNAAEAALQALSSRGPSHSLAARILDETGVYKNLLQEISQRVGAPLPSYTTIRSGLGHHPVFSCTVELAGIEFTGEPAKNKKQAEKNAAMAAWSSLKQLAKEAATSSSELENNDEQEQITIARALLNYRLKEKMAMANNPYATPFPKKFQIRPDSKPFPVLNPPSTTSKILPLIQPKYSTRTRPTSPATADRSQDGRLNKFAAAGAAPYIPVQHFSMPYHGGMAPSVTIRTAVPVFSAPPLPRTTGHHLPPVMNPPVRMASPVRIRPPVRPGPVYAARPPVPAASSVIPIQLRERPSAFAAQTPGPAASSQLRERPSAFAAQTPGPAASIQLRERPSAFAAKPPGPAASSVIPIQLRERPSPVVALQDPPAMQPAVAVVSLDRPVKAPAIAAALPERPAVPVQVNEVIPEILLKDVPPVAATSTQARPLQKIQKAVDRQMDALETSALASLKQLEI